MQNPRTDRFAALAIFAGSAAYFASFRPWTRPLLLDAATWDYMAVEIARGLVPYRDVFLHKTPGAALLGSLGASAGSALGIEPVLAAHTLFLGLGALAPALLYLVARPGLPRAAAAAAAIALLGYDEWTVAALEGCRPKVPTVVFGLASMLAAGRGAPWCASMLGGVSVLCWQPGLAFLLGSWATILHRGERRPLRLLGIAVASLLPAAALLAWLAAHGALADFFDQAVLFNLHYIQDKARTPLGTLRAFARTTGQWNVAEALMAPAAVAGLWARRRAGQGPPGSPSSRLPESVLVSGAIYGAMTFVSYQSWPDSILLGPVIALLTGVGLHALFAARLPSRTAAAWAFAVLLLAAFPDDKAKFHPSSSFAAQRERFAALAAGLSREERIVGVSVPEFFLHTGRRNGWKWPYLWFGVDEFAAARHSGGFGGMLDELDRHPPALILVARLWAGPERRRFEQWAADRYDVRTQRIFPHTRRPLRVYRRKT